MAKQFLDGINVTGNVTAAGAVQSSATIQNVLSYSGGYGVVGTLGNYGLQFYTNGAARATLDTSGNLTGLAGLSATNLTGSLQTAAQTNITSVGTLTGLTISGNVTAAGAVQSDATIRNILSYVTGYGVVGTLGNYGLQFYTNGAARATLDTSGNLTGLAGLSATNLTGSLQTAAQTNITSVGTLTGLTISGNVSLTATNALVTIGGVSAASSSTIYFQGYNATTPYASIVVNNPGALFGIGADSASTGDIRIGWTSSQVGTWAANSTGKVHIASTAAMALLVDGGISATTFTGSGSGLTSIPNSALTTNLAAIGNLANATGVLSNNGSGTFSYATPLTNPMTTLGAIIIGGTAGASTSLVVGSAGQMLTVVSGSPAWATPAAVRGSFANLVISTTGASAAVAITFDQIMLMNSTNVPLLATSGSLSLTLASSGSATGNDLDIGTAAFSTWYYIFVISNGTTTAGLASTATTPTLPSGYNWYARVGAVRTQSATNKYPLHMIQQGRNAQYVVAATGNVTARPALANGTVTVSNVTVPTTACQISMLVTAIASTSLGSDNYSATYCGPTASNTCVPAYAYVSGANGSNSTSAYSMGTFNLETTTISTTLANGSCAVIGWTDNL